QGASAGKSSRHGQFLLGLRLRRRGRHPDLDLALLDADLVTADLDARRVRPGPVAEAKAPGVPRAGDGAVLHVAAAQRRAHVRANVVDRVIPAAVQEHRDQLVADADGLALPLADLLDAADRLKIAHPKSFLDPEGCGCPILLVNISETAVFFGVRRLIDRHFFWRAARRKRPCWKSR